MGLIWAIWRRGQFGHVFRYGVTLFKPNSLSPPWSKMNNFSAHQKEEDLRISIITLLLFLVLFLGELWPLKHGNIFFGTPCTSHSICEKEFLCHPVSPPPSHNPCHAPGSGLVRAPSLPVLYCVALHCLYCRSIKTTLHFLLLVCGLGFVDSNRAVKSAN